MKIKIRKLGFVVLVSVAAMLLIIGGVIGYQSGGPPNNVGHSIGELEDVQKRVSESCSTGESIRVINTDGTVECETDDSAGSINNLVEGEGVIINNPSGPIATIGIKSSTTTSIGGIITGTCLGSGNNVLRGIDSNGEMVCGSSLGANEECTGGYTPGSKCKQGSCIDPTTRNRANVFLCRTDGSWLDTGFHDNSCGLPFC